MMQFIRFGLVGALGTFVNMAVFEGLRLTGMHYTLASILSFLVAATGNYLLNRRWTFRAARDSAGGWLLYIAVNGAGLLANLGVLVSLRQWGGWPTSLAQLAGIGAGMVLNFVLSKTIVFRSGHEKGDGYAEPSPLTH
ncbi:MAG: GtrA family protein [Leptospiraceae bacterium]|nr:GtrA family protein [Leptospiraceae bacterium]